MPSNMPSLSSLLNARATLERLRRFISAFAACMLDELDFTSTTTIVLRSGASIRRSISSLPTLRFRASVLWPIETR